MFCEGCVDVNMNRGVYSASMSLGKIGGGGSNESEHDLGAMVREFLENGGSGDADSCYSSDSESVMSDLAQLDDKITVSR